MRRLRAAVVVFVATAALSQPASAATPSFLCTRAQAWTEKAVCASSELAALDLELAVVRARVAKAVSATTKRALDDEHRQWWAALGECRRASQSKACLAGRYEHRIQALRLRPDYPGDAPAKRVAEEPKAVASAGNGWTRDLSAYLRALRACKEESPVAVGKLLVAWSTGDGESVALRLADWNRKEWVCIAHREGHKVFRMEPRGESEPLPPAGPVYHLTGETSPPACVSATQVVDPNGKPAGWITDEDC